MTKLLIARIRQERYDLRLRLSVEVLGDAMLRKRLHGRVENALDFGIIAIVFAGVVEQLNQPIERQGAHGCGCGKTRAREGLSPLIQA